MRIWLDAARQLLAPDRCPGCDTECAIGDEGFCGLCAPLLESYKDGPVAFAYGGPMAGAIQSLKYAGRIDFGRPLGELLAEFARPLIVQVDTIVPMPLHPLRFRKRGYNQAALLAKMIARRYSLPLDLRMIQRTRPTLEQVSLSPALRQDNVSNAFVASSRAHHKRVLLVDDVRTTGATLNAASEALLRAGVERVIMVALAGRRH